MQVIMSMAEIVVRIFIDWSILISLFLTIFKNVALMTVPIIAVITRVVDVPSFQLRFSSANNCGQVPFLNENIFFLLSEGGRDFYVIYKSLIFVVLYLTFCTIIQPKRATFEWFSIERVPCLSLNKVRFLCANEVCCRPTDAEGM